MKKIYIHKQILLGALLSLLLWSVNAQAQEDGEFFKVTVIALDENENPIEGAIVEKEGDGEVEYTNKKGKAVIYGAKGNKVIVKAVGKKVIQFQLDPDNNKPSFTLEKEDEHAYNWVNNGFNVQPITTSSSAVGLVDQEEMKNSYSLNVATALAGKAPSLFVNQTTGNLGWDISNLTIRGVNTTGDNAPVVYIDGFPRSIYNINIEEIETIEVLKDIRAKILVGSSAVNGVIWITTKRGAPVEKSINISYEEGVHLPTAKATYLDAYEYAKLYNEARINDGLTPYYSAEALEAYRTGSDRYRYPNNNFSDMFLNDMSSFRKATLSLSGATAKSKYFATMGYSRQDGFEKVGTQTAFDRLNIRGNLDVNLSKVVSLKADVVARMDLRESNNLSGRSFYDMMSTHRPNEYPLFFYGDIDESRGASPTDFLGYGVSQQFTKNFYGEVADTGYQKEQRLVGQSSLGLTFDLNHITKGLSAETFIALDTYQDVNYGQTRKYDTWLATYHNGELSNIVSKQQSTEVADQSKNSDYISRNIGSYAKINYHRDFAQKSSFDIQSLLSYNQAELKSEKQNAQQLVGSLLASVNLGKRFLIDAVVANYGTNRIAKDKHTLNYAFSGGWVLSEESFKPSFVNYLKLKGSYGQMATDISMASYFLHQNIWKQGGSVSFGKNNNTIYNPTKFDQVGNANLTWEKLREFNVGLEGTFFNHLDVELNYFNERRYDIPQLSDNIYPTLTENTTYRNIGEVKNQGIELSLNYQNKVGKLNYQVGLNALYTQSEVIKGNTISYLQDAQNYIGKPVGAIFGWEADGLFQSEEEISNHATQTFGTVQKGDIKYIDQNNDGVINQDDRVMIGDTTPDYILTGNVNLSYRNFSLYMQWTGVLGRDVLLNNNYYWNYGERKYSAITKNRWSETEETAGTYPRLTTQSGENNFRKSSFWVEDGSFLKLSNIQVSYQVPIKKVTNNIVKQLTVFAKGNNVLTFSKIKDFDPESISAGISNFPLLSSYSVGVNVNL